MKRRWMTAFLMVGCVMMAACQNPDGSLAEKQNAAESAAEQGEAAGAAEMAEPEMDNGSGDGAGQNDITDEHRVQAAGEANGDNAQSEEPETAPECTEAPAASAFSVRILDDLNLDYRLLTETFYKPGMRSSLSFYTTGMDTDTNLLYLHFGGWDEENQGFHTYMASGELETKAQELSYAVTPEVSEDFEKQEDAKEKWQLSFVKDGEGFHVSVSGAGKLDGDYFTLDQMMSLPDLSERYLNRADLYRYSKEELRILRNEIFAIHGAAFSAEDLNAYFGEKVWYEGNIPTTEFSEDRLSDLEKANAELIKELDGEEGLLIDGSDCRAEFDALPEAPYLSLLDQFEETGIHVDMREARDMGCYYAVQGEIRVPVTFTQEQIDALEEGESLEAGVNEWNGQTMMLRKLSDSEPGQLRYWYYEKGTEPDEYTMDANASLDLKNGLYTLWYMSDDTIMKTVYEGDIFILKGATRGDYPGLIAASKDQRELKIPESEEDIWNKEVWSNRIRHDGRGYITAVYYLGD